MAVLTVFTAGKCTKHRVGGDISDLRHSCQIPQIRRRGQTPVGAKAEPPWVSRSRPHLRDGLSAAMPNVYREILKRLAASAIARRVANLTAPALSPYPPGQANAPGDVVALQEATRRAPAGPAQLSSLSQGPGRGGSLATRLAQTFTAHYFK